MRNLASSFTMRRDRVVPHGEWYSIQNKESETPKVYIYDEIGFWGVEASEFIKDLNALDAKKIDLHMSSPGGEIFDGIAIYNAIKQHSAEITVYVDGLAASAASFIAQGGDKLVMARNAQMMIHDGIAFGYGNAADHREIATLLDDISDNIADIYAQAAKRRGNETTLEQYRDLMREETWYNGKEALEAGLADEITDADEDEAKNALNKWDLSFYNHAGRDMAEPPSRVAARVLIANQAKEKEMAGKKSTPKNEGGTGPAEETETPPQETPTPGEAAPEETPDENTPEETEPPVVKPAVPPEPQPENRQGVLINGKLVTDWTAVQSHINSLETAQQVSVAEYRKDFIEGLSNAHKIPASQVDHLINLVNGDGDKLAAMSDEQFAAFKASYESAPASHLFDPHASDAPSGEQPGSSFNTPTNKAERIKVLEGTVAVLNRQMDPEKVKNTDTYKELQSLLGNQS